MPTTPIQTYSVTRLDPLINADDAFASMVRVALKPSTVYASGTILGEITATPGTYAPYASGNADGTQNPAVILQYPCTTDAAGNITSVGEWGATQTNAAAFTQGTFRTQELVGLDANAVTKLGGHLVEGSVTTGIFSF